MFKLKVDTHAVMENMEASVARRHLITFLRSLIRKTLSVPKQLGQRLKKVFAIDCEMVHTTKGMEAVKVCVIDENGNMITNYNTK